ncbi:hypothetical protein Tco_0910970 [Tanacetum coccineum]|uniref:Transcription factor TFIIIC triple barrel domain-containing protein n=1 Tax=Tanacetum coccineum TaxID=301880 RepID=A0ABQ5CUF0_9ASTR
MGRDIIQLDDAVSTISGEYLLEFTSEYGILEDLHPELPCPENTIVDFPEGKVEMDLFNLISASNPVKVKTGTRPRAAYEKSPLDFADEDLPPPNTEGVGTEEQIQDELSREIPLRKRMRRKRANDKAGANAPPKVLRKDHVSSPAHSAYEGKSLATMGLGVGSISSTPSAQGVPTVRRVSSRGTATEIPTEHVATT